MRREIEEQEIFVEAPGRLHFGVLDLRGAFGRWFGGIGAAAPGPTLLLSASRAATLEVVGEDADRAADFARRFQESSRVPVAARLHVHRALPVHAGLGSGTQLGLAVARALAELSGAPAGAPDLARAIRRASRSAVGTWTFAGGGLVVEGGRRVDVDGMAPLLARLPFPPSWRCVVAVPDAPAGISGGPEEFALAKLPRPPRREVERLSHLVLMGLLPALAEGDLPNFGAALSSIQEITGSWFASVQGGTFAPGPSEGLVRRMAEWGASGVGQSSWGPTVYGIVGDPDAGRRLAERVSNDLGSNGNVHEGAFPAGGARVWQGRLDVSGPRAS